MPAYNSELYIQEAIESILTQTFGDFELLIYNDGSTDCTSELIETYKDERIVYYNSSKNLGYLEWLNDGLARAKGKYIVRMDSDDISMPSRFQEQYDFMESNPEVGICGSWFQSFGGSQGLHQSPVSFEEIRYHLFYGCPLTHPSVMMRKDLLDKYGLRYDQKYYYAEDHDLFFRGSLVFKLENLPRPLLKYRSHPEQIGSAKWMEQRHIKNTIQANMFTKVLSTRSEKDSKWLFDFFTLKATPHVNWSEEVTFYHDKLIGENLKTNIFPQNLFEKVCREMFEGKRIENLKAFYYKKYYLAERFNLYTLNKFLREKVKAHKFLGARLTFKFVVKCLLGYKRKVQPAP